MELIRIGDSKLKITLTSDDMAQYERECKQRQNREDDTDTWSRPWNDHDDKKLIQYFRTAKKTKSASHFTGII